MSKIINMQGQKLRLRRLTENDAASLGDYFENLSEDTKEKFQPHPLTRIYATYLCHKSLENVMRFVISDNDKKIYGYFILDFDLNYHEAERYKDYGIRLEPGRNAFFAPSIDDKLQDSDIASQTMDILLELLREETVDRLVLLGGAREDNNQALTFYEEFGFEKVGGYKTDIWNYDMQLMLQ